MLVSWRMLASSKLHKFLAIMAIATLAFLIIFKVGGAYVLISSYKTVGDILKKTYNNSGPLTTSTMSPLLDAKLQEIYQDLNVSKSNTEPIVYPTFGDYVMLNRSICHGPDVIDFIIIVHTAPYNLDRRSRMRETFAKEALFLPFHVRVAFLLGRTANLTLGELLILENTAHGDLIMGDFLDDYHNLTLKGVMGYHWVSQYCNNSRLVVKLDDDVVVNMFKLLFSFHGRVNNTRSIFCFYFDTHTNVIYRSGKWNVPHNIFRSHNNYPYFYCTGFVVLISTDLVGPMYHAAKVTPFFWIDDVYLFGILPYVVGGVTFHKYALGEILSISESWTKTCFQSQGMRCPILASLVSDKNFWTLWDIIKDTYMSTPWRSATKFIT